MHPIDEEKEHNVDRMICENERIMHPIQTITDDNFDGQLRSAVEALIAKASDIVVGKAELEVKNVCYSIVMA